MSGALAQHRTGNKPQDIGGQKVYKVPREGVYPFDLHAIKRTLRPGGTYKDGRCVDYQVQVELRQRHVLDYTPEHHWPSAHLRGRTRPRTRAEQQRSERIRRRAAQAQKSMTIDFNRLRTVYDEVAIT